MSVSSLSQDLMFHLQLPNFTALDAPALLQSCYVLRKITLQEIRAKSSALQELFLTPLSVKG